MELAQENWVRHLADCLRGALDLSDSDRAVDISPEVAKFAIRRHRVGPLLYRALQHKIPADCSAAIELENSAKANQIRQLARRAATRKLFDLFQTEAIPCVVLKGVDLGDQLYREPTLRQTKDVDFLVQPKNALRAFQSMNAAGYVYISQHIRRADNVPLHKKLGMMSAAKDACFKDPELNVTIELHQRLFMLEPNGLSAAFWDAFGDKPMPDSSNIHYALYIILHGALTQWHRMKWLCDLSLLLRHLEQSQAEDLIALASQYDCRDAVIASVRLAEQLFPETCGDHWLAVIGQSDEGLRAGRILRSFYKALTTSANNGVDRKRHRWRFGNPARDIFASKIPLHTAVIARARSSYALRR